MSFWVDWDNPLSLANWSEQIGLICRPGWQIGLLGSAYYAGWCSTLLWMPRLSEIYGRARFFKFAMALNTLMFTVLMFSRSYALTLTSIFIVGFFTSMRTGIGWPYLLELVPKRDRPYHATLYGIIGANWGVIGAVFFVFCSKNAYYFMGFGYVLQITALVISLTLPESPVYLLSKGKLKEGEEALAKIAKVNGATLRFDYNEFSDWASQETATYILESPGSVGSYRSVQSPVRGVKQQGQNRPQEDKQTVSYFLGQHKIQVNLAIMTLNWLTCALNNTMISFLLKYFPGNIYFNGFMSCLSEVLGTFVSGLLMLHYTPKWCLESSFTLAGVGGVGMLIYLVRTDYYGHEEHTFSTGEMLIFGGLILIVKIGNASAFNVLYGATTLMFPPLFSVTAFGISNFFARVCSFFSPQLAEIQSTLPIGLMTGLYFASTIATQFLI